MNRIEVLRSRRAEAAARADRLAEEWDKFPNPRTAAELQRAAAAVNALDAQIGQQAST
jgi:hypothetical protein